MSFREEMSIIPKTARWIAVLIYLTAALLIVNFVLPHKPERESWPIAAQIAITVLAPLPGTILVLLIGYVYADSKRRGMRYVLWTFIAIFVPQGIGVILYFIMRDPLLSPCPTCGSPARQGHAFCWKCGTSLGRACPQCRKSVEVAWTHCVYCGATLSQT